MKKVSLEKGRIDFNSLYFYTDIKKVNMIYVKSAPKNDMPKKLNLLGTL